jgi:predicted outer membrane repeat protein
LGGAIYNTEGGTLTIRDGIIGTNSADQDGGAVYNKGTLRIEGGSFSGNCAGDQGGAIYNEGTINILKCYMYMNEALNGGGAIYNAEGGRLAVSNVFFSNNISKDGGAICNKSSTV